eukprot:709757-Prymnesium_polylepis.1
MRRQRHTGVARRAKTAPHATPPKTTRAACTHAERLRGARGPPRTQRPPPGLSRAGGAWRRWHASGAQWRRVRRAAAAFRRRGRVLRVASQLPVGGLLLGVSGHGRRLWLGRRLFH